MKEHSTLAATKLCQPTDPLRSAQDKPEPQARSWGRECVPTLERWAGEALVLALSVLVWLVYGRRLDVKGDAIWPDLQGRPVLLVANHASHLDFMLMAYVLRQHHGRRIAFLAKQELWDSLLWRLMMRQGRSIPVNRTDFSISSLRAVHRAWGAQQVVGIFPEGTRSDDGRMGPVKQGIELLIRRHPEVLCVPCGLQGFHEAWPKSKPLTWPLPRGHRLRMSFGQPRSLAEALSPCAKTFARHIMADVAELAGQPQAYPAPADELRGEAA